MGGVVDKIVNKMKKTETVVALTSLGQQKAETGEFNGASWDIVYCLKDHGPCGIQELAMRTHFSPGKIKFLVNQLRYQRLVEDV